MAYAAPSIILKPPIGGQRKDKALYDVPEDAAATLRNFILQDGRVKVRPGYTKAGTTLGAYGTGLFSYISHAGVQTIVAATKSKWFKWNPTTQAWVDITPAGNPLTGGDDSHQIFRVFYKAGVAYLLGCNGYTDNPIKWNGTDAEYADIGGSPGKAKCMAVMANRLIMGNFDGYPVMIDVSDFNDFESGWGAVQQINLYDTPGEIVSMNEFGNLTMFIYKTDAIYQAIATATSYPMSLSLKYAGVAGPMSPRCVVATPKAHFILARDLNVYRFDGTSYTPIGDHAKSHLLETVSIDKMDRSWGFYDPLRNEVWFLYPNSGSAPNHGLALRMDGTVWPLRFDSFYPTAGSQFLIEKVITIGDMVNALSTYTLPLQDYSSKQLLGMLCDSTGQVYSNQGTTDDGDAIPFSMRTGMRAPSKEMNFCITTEIDHFFKRSAGSQVVESTLCYSDEDFLSPTECDPQSFDIGTAGPHSVGHRKTSRFFGLMISGDADEEVTWEGAKIQGIERGER